MIYRIDLEVGRLVKHIEESGDLDNTMILFVSDNGACPFGKNPLHADADHKLFLLNINGVIHLVQPDAQRSIQILQTKSA